MIADKKHNVNQIVNGVYIMMKKVYKIIYKSVDSVHEIVYLIATDKTKP